MGLRHRRVRPNHWRNADNVDAALEAFVHEHGKPSEMPTHRDLLEHGHGYLIDAIKNMGGFAHVARQKGWTYSRVENGYWEDPANAQKELEAFIQAHGTPGVMPTQRALKKLGRYDLIAVIDGLGGFQSVAERFGYDYRGTLLGRWKTIDAVKAALDAFTQEHGRPGVMPTEPELMEHGRHDLIHAITKYGGFVHVARLIGYTYVSYERITPHTAERVERIVRSIQPLAEHNLLSGAQVMLILRRAGLLEYRNPRIVRLATTLVKGERKAIEAALAAIVGQLGDDVHPDDEADAALSERALTDLADEGQDARPQRAPTASHPIRTPDVERERAVIRGLSALGSLRLPLDQILGLVTSALLWEAFYQRLYQWYGSLDATQQVTARDIEETILSVYPGHADNEFVARACALFAQEVEAAVNFAAALPAYGWRGPRLRLHQADAGRRMADVLAERHEHGFVLNADDPGLGKTAAFLAAVCASGVRTVAIVAPKTVADDTWAGEKGEIRSCFTPERAAIVHGLPALRHAPAPDRLTFFVLHYDEVRISAGRATLADRAVDALCFDEAHVLKQRANQRVSRRRDAMQGLRATARTAIALTGTPLVNELSEPLSLMQVLSQDDPQFAVHPPEFPTDG